MDVTARKRLGEILIERGKLDQPTLERALRLQQESEERLGALLVTLGVVAQRDVADALSEQLALPLVDAASYPEFPILEERVSTRFLRETRVLPLREDDTEVALAMADPTDTYTIGALEMVTGRSVLCLRVRHGTRNMVVSSCRPPESVSTIRAFDVRLRNSR